MVATASSVNEANSQKPAAALDRRAGEHGGGRQASERGRAAQQAGAPGADAEDVARIDRQQRVHAAEQRRHELEQHGAEDRLAAPDEAEADRDRFPVQLHPLFRLAGIGQQEAADRGHKRQAGADAIVEHRPEIIEDAAEHRADQHRGLPRRDMRSDSAAEHRARRHHLQQRLHDRLLEGARRHVDCDQRIDEGERGPVLRRHPHEPGGGQERHAVAPPQHGPAVEPVGDLAGGQHQEELRNELGEPDQPEMQRAVGELIDMPADNDADHLEGGGRGDAGNEEQPEGGNFVEWRRGIDRLARDGTRVLFHRRSPMLSLGP